MSQVRLDSAQGLFESLRGSDMAVRMATLKAIRNRPDLALAFGQYQGMDVVDELVAQSLSRHGYSYWMILVSALGAFDDPRVVLQYVKILANWDRAEVMSLVVARLSWEPVTSLSKSVRGFLQDDAHPRRVWAAARLMRAHPELTPPERVRVACADPDAEEAEKVPVDEMHLPAWRRELAGSFGPVARLWLEDALPGKAATIASLAGGLSDEDEAWLISILVRHVPLEAIPIVRKALEGGRRSAKLEALRCVAVIEGWPALFKEPVNAAAASEDEEIRIAAVRAGATRLDWRANLGQSDARLVAEAAEGLARAEGVGAMAD
ncbi:hypothetical protein EON79_09070, partial [bacterium]